MSIASISDSTAGNSPSTIYAQLDTTRASLLHRWTAFNGKIWWRGVVIYVVTTALTYGAMLAAVLASDVPAATASPGVKLPFLQDWNIAFTFLVSLPVVLFLLVSDQRVLRRALQQVLDADVVVPLPDKAPQLIREWSRRFRRENLHGQWIILLVAAILSAITLNLYRRSNAGFWAAPAGQLRLVGVVYWYCITVLYFVLGFYCFRCVRQATFLRDLVDNATFQMRPFHPDGCGGLQPIGRLGLRNQYTLTVLGLNILIVAAINYTGVAPSAQSQIVILVAIATVIYLILGPLVFLAPLLPFGERMREEKSKLMSGVGDRLRLEFLNVQRQLKTEAIDKTELEAIERLKKLADMLNEIPVWPFDARTLRRFGTAYALPLAASIATKAATSFLF
jgi:hypothetical protein